MTRRSEDRRPARRLAAFAALYCLWVACSTLVPRQGWDASLGPVVPHDSFPTDCSLCHTGSDWNTLKADFAFDHEKETGVALHGAHAGAACLLCHNDRGPVQQFATQGCGGCHADPHKGQLGRTCADCHDERTWHPSEMIARHDRTRFPLVGAHAATACFRCHPGAQVANFAGASPECAHCHEGEFVRSSLDHVGSGFTDGCERCHRPTGWIPAQFGHPVTFPLTNGHAGRACSDCHVGGTFAGLSRACASCHLDDFQATTDPPHAAFSFGTTCEQCHDTRTFRNARFAHPFFPISGPHAGLGCRDCHTTNTSATFSCTHCHDHRQSEMDNKHDDVGGYQWVSQRCFDCHPNGRG